MAKKFTRAELVEKSQIYFDTYKGEQKFFATEDGTFFKELNHSQAKTHARNIDPKGKPFEILRSEVEGAEDTPKTPEKATKKETEKTPKNEGGENDELTETKTETETKEQEPEDETEGANDSTETLEVDGEQVKVGPELVEPEYKWTMEQMADWMNEHDGEFDLKDDKSALWKKVKAHLAKIKAEAEDITDAAKSAE